MRSDRSGLAARGERFLPARSLLKEVGRSTERQTLLRRLPLLLTLSLCVVSQRASPGLRRIDAVASARRPNPVTNAPGEGERERDTGEGESCSF